MISYLKNLYKPDVFHGANKKNNFFEGWFYKIVDRSGENVLAVIPGIFMDKERKNEHSFIQILSGADHGSNYIRYDSDEFVSERGKFSVKVGSSYFSNESIFLDLDSGKTQIEGELRFINLKPWPVTLTSPGIMGWYAFVPFMECNHAVLSLDHEIIGNLTINGKKIDFGNGRGYIEKDWGKSFPSSYVWSQSNHFSNPGISFTGSIAKIPWIFSSFRGFIIGLLLDGTLHKFTTYNGSKLHFLKINNEKIEYLVENKTHSLRVKAMRTEGGILHGPYNNQMLERVSESLDTQIEIELSEARTGKVIFRDKGERAGLDVNGKLDEITDGL